MQNFKVLLLTIIATASGFSLQSLSTSPAITEWENELPLLIYHGLNENCSAYHTEDVMFAWNNLMKQTGKNIYAGCIDVTMWGTDQMASSVHMEMLSQVASYCKQIQEHPIFGQSDFNLMAMSQGGMASRAMIQNCDLGKYKVHNYISMGGPQYGVSSNTMCINGTYCEVQRTITNWGAYWHLAQKFLAPASYYLNPKDYAGMLEYSTYLPYINNLKPHAKYDQYKERFSALNRATFVLYDKDQTIYPRESCQFGMFDEDGNVLTMKETVVWKKDTLGLQGMTKKGSLFFQNYPDQEHLVFTLADVNDYYLPALYQAGFKMGQVSFD